jgi:hypothetical protein
MKYKSQIKIEVRALRHLGWTLDQISKEKDLPITTIHSWVRDIDLSAEQLEEIRIRSLKLLQEGRERVQNENKKQYAERKSSLFEQARLEISNLSPRDIFIAGIALYWAEGFKNRHERRLGFCNSDPHMIKFYLSWLELLGIKRSQIVARLSLNASYKNKTEKIVNFWSETTNIPIDQFTKTFYQYTTWKKEFVDENYFGVLRVHVQNSLDLQLKMRGWIEGLKVNLPG